MKSNRSATAASTLITDAQKEQFIELGYCVVPNLFTAKEIRDIENFFEDYRHVGGHVFDAGSAYEEIDPTQRQLRAMHPHRYSQQAMGWFLNPNVAEVLEELFTRPALGAQTMYYFKPPGAKGQGMHQDNFYLLAKPATCIAAWTAIDPADNDNGCMWVVPKSQQLDIICPAKDGGETWMNYGDTHIYKFPREHKAVPVPVPRGSTMFFGGNLIHGSGPNRTKDRSRRTFIGHYIDAASEQVAKFYHPIVSMNGEVMSRITAPEGGGPCGDGWLGAQH